MTTPDGSLPGDRLRSIASRVCSANAMTWLIDPVIADLQTEYADAADRGQVWWGRWVRLAGYIAFWKVFVFSTTTGLPQLATAWADANDGAMRRTLRFSAAAIAMVTVVQALLPLSTVMHEAEAAGAARVPAPDVGRLLVYFVLQVLYVGAQIGFATGILCGLRGRSATAGTRRSIVMVAVAASVLLFAVTLWLGPSSTAWYRDIVGTPAVVVNAPGSLGAQFEQHQRWAGSPAILVLALFAFSLSAATRGCARSIAIGIPAVVLYVFSYTLTAVPVFNGWLPPMIAAWLPNLFFIGVTAAMMRWRADI
jgi:Lipopolysaccharide export system permease LptF/LptG